MLKKAALTLGGAPHLTGCGVYEMLAIRLADLSKERKNYTHKLQVAFLKNVIFFSLSVAALPVVLYKIVFELMVKLPDLVKLVLYDFFFL